MERSSPAVLLGIHHIAVICSNYERSKYFYVEVLGLKIISETYRQDRKSFKLDLAIRDGVQLELFSFPSPPPRPSRPEACGLRHLAFAVADLAIACGSLAKRGIEFECVRVDELTGRKFVFFSDPDGLPIELYELQ